MILIPAASGFFMQFGVGAVMALALVWERELKKSFYLFQSVFASVFLIIGVLLGGWRVSPVGSPGSYLLASIPLVLIFYAFWAAGQSSWARISLFFAIVFGLIGLLGTVSAESAGLTLTTGQTLLINLNRLAATFLSGIVISTLVLGHWYLISPRLSFKPLLRGSLLFFAAVWLRLFIVIAVFCVFGWGNGLAGELFLNRLFTWDDLGMFFILRFFWGILGPLILSYMIYKTAQIQSNQSATGILYVALVFVLIGELITNYLWAMARIPL